MGKHQIKQKFVKYVDRKVNPQSGNKFLKGIRTPWIEGKVFGTFLVRERWELWELRELRERLERWRVERKVRHLNWESGRKKNTNNNILLGCGNKKLIVSLAFSYNAQPYIAVHCNYIDKNFTNTITNIATLLYMVKIAF